MYEYVWTATTTTTIATSTTFVEISLDQSEPCIGKSRRIRVGSIVGAICSSKYLSSSSVISSLVVVVLLVIVVVVVVVEVAVVVVAPTCSIME